MLDVFQSDNRLDQLRNPRLRLAEQHRRRLAGEDRLAHRLALERLAVGVDHRQRRRIELATELELAERALPLTEHAKQLEEEHAESGIGRALPNPLLQQLERPGRVALRKKLLGGRRAHHVDKTSSENDVDAPLRPEPCWRLYSTSIFV